MELNFEWLGRSHACTHLPAPWLKRSASRLLLITLVACGGGGSESGGPTPGPEPQADADYFPLAVGDRWTYRDERASLSTARVTGSRVAQGVNAIVVRSDDAAGSSEDLYDKTAAGVFVLASAGADAVERALASVPVLKLPLVAGSSDVTLDRSFPGYADFDGDGRADTLSLRAVSSVVGFETLTTPAGRLSNVAHTRTVLTATATLSSNGQTAEETITSDDWFAPDIGLVRSVGTAVGGGGEVDTVAYRVGSRRSESVAPTAASVTPVDKSASRAGAVSVRFSEPMDRFAGGDFGLTLRDSTGQAVAGSMYWDDEQTLRFQPTTPLGTGAYRASLTPTAEDWAGNKLATTREWTFDIDVTGPQVVSSHPAQGAVEVPLSSAITLVFDEEPDPMTVNAGTITLVDLRASVFLSADVSLSGRTVTVTPAAPFQRDGSYRVNVAVSGQVRDRLGNLSPGYSLDFRADPGRFSAAAALPGIGSNVFAAGVADFSGDGRDDIVVLSDAATGEPGVVRVRVLYGRADGTMAPAETLSTGLACAPGSMVVGDIDGDGRSDLVVAGTCGLAVLRQLSAGRLMAQVIDNRFSNVLALVRQATDGRMGVLNLVAAGAELRLDFWRQTAPGTFVSAADFPQVMNSTNSVATADFDGDGRADMVLSGLLASNNGNGIAVLYQRPDGSFGGMREFPLTLSLPTNDVAAGDINGDGRPDIVFTTCCNSPTFIGYLTQRADGSFTAMSTFTSYDLPQSIVVEDITADGKADAVVSHESGNAVGLYVQKGGALSGETLFQAPYGCLGLNNLAFGDFNGDGLRDIVYCNAVLIQRPAPVASAGPRGSASALWRHLGPARTQR